MKFNLPNFQRKQSFGLIDEQSKAEPFTIESIQSTTNLVLEFIISRFPQYNTEEVRRRLEDITRKVWVVKKQEIDKIFKSKTLEDSDRELAFVIGENGIPSSIYLCGEVEAIKQSRFFYSDWMVFDAIQTSMSPEEREKYFLNIFFKSALAHELFHIIQSPALRRVPNYIDFAECAVLYYTSIIQKDLKHDPYKPTFIVSGIGPVVSHIAKFNKFILIHGDIVHDIFFGKITDLKEIERVIKEFNSFRV